MADILFSQINYSLDTLLQNIKLGVIGLPEISTAICLAKFKGKGFI